MLRYILNSLKRNKAAGPDELDLEHLHFGGQQLVKVLTLLFNSSMVLAGHIPLSFRHGLVIPITKGHNKDLANPSTIEESQFYPTSVKYWRNW